MEWVTFHNWAWVTLLLTCKLLLIYGMTSLLLLDICPSFFLSLLLVHCERRIQTWEIVGENWIRLWERELESKCRAWWAKVDSVLIQLKGRLILCVHLCCCYQWSSCYNLFRFGWTYSFIWSLIALCIFVEQLISNRRRIWLGFPLWVFPCSLDLNSLSHCILGYLLLCIWFICSIYDWLSNIAA